MITVRSDSIIDLPGFGDQGNLDVVDLDHSCAQREIDKVLDLNVDTS